jgi:hypothetical protein
VVATAPATGAVDQVVGVVTSQPLYSFTDVAVSSMALFVLGGSASNVGPVFSLLIALVVFAIGAYRARRLVSADHDDSSSDSTHPCSPVRDYSPISDTHWSEYLPPGHHHSPAPSPEPVETCEYSPVSDRPWPYSPDSPTSGDECSSDQRGPVLFGLMGLRSGSACGYSSGSTSLTPFQRWAASQRHEHSPSERTRVYATAIPFPIQMDLWYECIESVCLYWVLPP